MEMVFAILIAIMLDRWAYNIPGGQFIANNRSSSWVNKYVEKAATLLVHSPVKQDYLLIAILLVPLILTLLLAQFVFWKIFGIVGNILFVAAVLFYLLGNHKNDRHDSEFIAAHERSFGILFWFSLLGPIGGLIYWFLTVTKKNMAVDEVSPSLHQALLKLHAIAAWLPARFTGFIYALVGNFSSGFNCWMDCMRSPKMTSRQVLNACGEAATDTTIESEASNLVNRSFVTWVIFSILIVTYIK